jgi:hypothetical protein
MFKFSEKTCLNFHLLIEYFFCTFFFIFDSLNYFISKTTLELILCYSTIIPACEYSTDDQFLHHTSFISLKINLAYL